MKFEITKTGSCTTFVTHTIIVEGESYEDAIQKYKSTGECVEITTEHDIDDDYSEIDED